MSKYKIKATCEGVVKGVEFDRSATVTLNQIKSSFEALFKANITAIRYQGSDGKLTPLYQDFHLVEAFKDAEKSRARFIQLDIDKYAPASASRPSNTAPVTQQQQQPSYNPPPSSQSSQSTSKTPSKFCEECGAPRAPNAKFCTECGLKWTTPQGGSVAPQGGSVAPPQDNQLLLLLWEVKYVLLVNKVLEVVEL